MTIDKSGKWWKGSAPQDIAPYLTELYAGSYPIHEHHLSVCDCGSEVFFLHWIPDEGAVRRTCTKCGKKYFVCDSEESWEGRPRKFKCIECKSVEANLGVSFSLYDDKSNIRWIYTGYRCVTCGVLGSFADWKIGYGPSLHLLSQA
jgi:hypothetical protein